MSFICHSDDVIRTKKIEFWLFEEEMENVATSYYIICSRDDFPAKILLGKPRKIFAGKSSLDHIM